MATPEQLHALLIYCLDFSRLMLSRAGTFYPFGAVLNVTGVVEARGAYDGNERPAPVDVYKLLEDGFAAEARASTIMAYALAVNVDVPAAYKSPFPDAIRVRLEAPGYSRFVYSPYQLGKKSFLGKRSEPVVADPFAVELNRPIFPQPPVH